MVKVKILRNKIVKKQFGNDIYEIISGDEKVK